MNECKPLIVGSSKASTARGTAVLIATFTLQVRSTFTDAQLSPLSGNIEAMTRENAEEEDKDEKDEPSPIDAGAGNVKVNGASRRRGLLQLVVPPGWLPLSLGGEVQRGVAGHTLANSLAVAAGAFQLNLSRFYH